MNVDEAYDVVNRLSIEWPYVRDWPDEKTAEWVQDVQELDYQRALRAIKLCREQHQHAPAWAQFREAYRTVSWQALAPERQEARAALPAAGVLPAAESLRRLKAVRKILTGDPGRAEHDHRRGAAGCPMCSKHTADDSGHHHPERCARCKTNGQAIYQVIAEPDPR